MSPTLLRLVQLVVTTITAWVAAVAGGRPSASIRALQQQVGATVTVSDPVHLVFALFNSSVQEVVLLEDVDLSVTVPLWPDEGAVRTTGFVLRGGGVNETTKPRIQSRSLFDALRVPDGAEVTLQGVLTASTTLVPPRVRPYGPGWNVLKYPPGGTLTLQDAYNELYICTQTLLPPPPRPSWAPPGNNSARWDGPWVLTGPGPGPRIGYVGTIVLDDYRVEYDLPGGGAPMRVVLVGYRGACRSLQPPSCVSSNGTVDYVCIIQHAQQMVAADDAVVPPATPALAGTPEQLRAVLLNNTIDTALVPTDVRLLARDVAVPRTANLTIRGAAPAGTYPKLWFAPDRVNLRPLAGVRLKLRQLVLKRLQTPGRYDAAVALVGNGKDAICCHPDSQVELHDAVLHYYACPAAQDMPVLAAAGPQLAGGLCVTGVGQQQQCWPLAWPVDGAVYDVRDAQNAVLYTVRFTASWVACGEALPADCQQQVRAGNAGCAAQAVLRLQAEEDAGPPPGRRRRSKAATVGVALGITAAVLLVTFAGAVLLYRRRRAGSVAATDSKHAALRPPSGSDAAADDQEGDRRDWEALARRLAESDLRRRGRLAERCSTAAAGVRLDLRPSDVALGAVLGQGALGVVHRATLDGRTPVAVKKLPAGGDYAAFRGELQFLSCVDHPNVVRLVGACLDPESPFLVEELCSGSLEQLLHPGRGRAAEGTTMAELARACRGEAGRQEELGPLLLPAFRSAPLRLRVLLGVALQVARGLEYLHPHVLHRDLKPANVLIVARPGEEGCSVSVDGVQLLAKLSDFGLSHIMASATLATGRVAVGTVPYMPPECFDTARARITCGADVYSFGVVLWEMVHGERPWRSLSPLQVMAQVVVRRQLLPWSPPRVGPDAAPWTGDLDAPLRRLTERCCSYDAGRRPPAEELVRELEALLELAA